MNSFNDKKAALIIAFLVSVSLLLFFCFAMLFTASGYGTFSYSGKVNSPLDQMIEKTVIIDAGHGGEDPGAVVGSVFEKDINLAVALYLGELFESGGYKVVYTRKEDKMLYLPGQSDRKKYFDLYNRVKIAEENENAILLSIHVNRFSSPKYSGLQVFYSNNCSESKILATHIQEKSRIIQPNNNRVAKDSKGSIYVLDKYDGIGVLIECGFLSNADELEKLCSDNYRRELALTIFLAVSEYINGDVK